MPGSCSFARHRANGPLPIWLLYKNFLNSLIYADIDSCFRSLDLHFKLQVSTSIFPSTTSHPTTVNSPQTFFLMSMIHNNGTSGQGSKPVRKFLQLMSLYTDANLPISARKLPCKICLRDQVRVSFTRRQELDRHIQLFHLPCWICCPYFRCQWRGCRIDELQKHLDDQQECNQNSAGQEYRIYDVKNILDIIWDAKSDDSIRIALDLAVDFVRERATELERHDWFAEPWGRLEQRERRESRTSRG